MGPDNELKIGRENLPLSGKVFLLTGASRGIGAATAVELAKRGAVVIGPHRDPGKDSRAAEVVRQVEEIGGRMVAPVADVTKPEHRARLLDEIKRDFGRIDGIIFNHAGGLERDLMEADDKYHLKVNGTSKQELFQEAELKRIFQDTVVAIDVPSLWSTFQHTGIDQLPQYGLVAQGKKLGEVLLRDATREYNSANSQFGKSVKFGSVSGHAIGDTTTIKLLSRMNRETMAAVEKTAAGGKLPEIADMAYAIADMASGTFEDEEIVFVGPPQIKKNEMADALPMYNRATRYVDNLVRFDARRAFGYYKVREEDTRPHFSNTSGGLKMSRSGSEGTTLVTFNHTLGHFVPTFGISILPGHKIVAAAAEVAGFNLENMFAYVLDPRLAGIDGPVQFKVPVVPGDRLSVEVIEPNRATADGSNVSVKVGNTEVALVAGLRFESKASGQPDSMTSDRFIEAAAQTLGLAFLHSNDIRDVLPLFGGVKGPIEYSKEVFPGQRLEMEAVLAEGNTAKKFSGDVTFRVDDEIVARVSGIDCRLFPARGLERVISLGRGKLE